MKGSSAALGMSLEARACGGGVKSLRSGGVTASLQSIGARGCIKAEARKNLAIAMRKLGLISERDYLISISDKRPMIVIEIPSYFSSPTPTVPLLMNDYRQGGYNQRQAERMLAESRGIDSRTNSPCKCCWDSNSLEDCISVQQIQRIENTSVFERFKAYEAGIAEKLNSNQDDNPTVPHVHTWLDRLARKNGLSRVANTVYLLHGTTLDKVDAICRDGLQTRFSLHNRGIYGKGLYFTTQSCKAFQYSKSRGCILVCRVVLGRIEILQTCCDKKIFPNEGFDSAMAKKACTSKSPGQLQVHDEFIVYNPAAAYPEFVLHVS